MSEKHIVVQGGTCTCSNGASPDTLKVLSHQKEYANDKNGAKKLIVTTKELGATFEANTFGPCKLQPIPGGYKPCQISVAGWEGYYQDVLLENGGYIITEDSKAICPIGGTCISIANHGQIAEPSQQNMDNADEDTQAQLNPMVNKNDISSRSSGEEGIEEGPN